MATVGSTKPADLDGHGHEVPDPKPLSLPVGFRRPETLAEQVQRLVRTSISRQAELEGYETFEDSEDFDLPDDPDDPHTRYEEYFDPVLGRNITAEEFRLHEETYRKRYIEAEMRAWEAMDQSDALRRRRARSAEPDEPKPSRAASERVSNPDGGTAAPK